MSNLNNGKAVIDKQALEAKALGEVVKGLVAGVESKLTKVLTDAVADQRRELQQGRDDLAKRIEDVRRESSVPITKNYVDTEPIAMAVRKALSDARGEDALDRAKQLGVFKDLLEAVGSMPVPLVQSPDVNPTPIQVNVDLSEISHLVADLNHVVGKLAERLDKTEMRDSRLLKVLDALLVAITKERPQRQVNGEFSDDGRTFTLTQG